MNLEKLKEWLEKIRLADFKKNITADQSGNVNIKIKNNTYNYNNFDPEALSKFLDSEIDDKIEIAIKKKTFERLKNLDSTLEWLTESTMTEVASGTTLSTAIDFVTAPPTTKPTEDE
jgi:hypothetical protein